MKDVVGVARETLETALASADDYHPKKLVVHLRADNLRDVGFERDGRVLTELIFTPESKPGDAFRVLGVDTLPRNSSIVGTVASCPSGGVEGEDYTRFTNRGRVHVVLFPPYDEDSWTAYDSDGAERELEVLEVEFGDTEGESEVDFGP